MSDSLPNFAKLEALVVHDPEGADMAAWARGLSPCPDAETMLGEYEWVVLCSGISYRAARSMQSNLARTGHCGHPHKDTAIARMRRQYRGCWQEYQHASTDAERLRVIRTWPYMGGKALPFQLAKNLGVTGFCKPDVHLNRLASLYGWKEPQGMCAALAKKYGETVAYVDTVLWFAAMQGWAYKEAAQ